MNVCIVPVTEGPVCDKAEHGDEGGKGQPEDHQAEGIESMMGCCHGGIRDSNVSREPGGVYIADLKASDHIAPGKQEDQQDVHQEADDPDAECHTALWQIGGEEHDGGRQVDQSRRSDRIRHFLPTVLKPREESDNHQNDKAGRYDA